MYLKPQSNPAETLGADTHTHEQFLGIPSLFSSCSIKSITARYGNTEHWDCEAPAKNALLVLKVQIDAAHRCLRVEGCENH